MRRVVAVLLRATRVSSSIALLLLASRAFAEEKPAVALEVESSCPSRTEVASALAPLLRDYRLVVGPAPSVARVRDLGESYSVSVNGTSREIADVRRLCEERARVAAVFLLLNLPQSSAPADEEATKPEPAPSPAVAEPGPLMLAPRAPLPKKATTALLLRSIVGVETAPGDGLAATSVALGAAFRRGPWGLSLLGAMATPTHPGQAEGGPARLKMWRFPLSLRLGWESGPGRVGARLEVGPTFDILHFQGEQVARASGGTRLNVGLGLNLGLRLQVSPRWQADVGPTLTYFPRTYLARVEPAPILAETPRWWAGLSLGLHYSIWER